VNRRVRDIEELIAPTIGAMGFELWGIDTSGIGSHERVCVYIDSVSGIAIEDCEAVSRQLSGLLDVDDSFNETYTLEVSSPGLDRILFEDNQFRMHIGQRLNIRLEVPLNGRRRVEGLLVEVENGELVLAVNDDEYLIPLERVRRARIVPQFD
tara:strand:- start:563 stop:1021 length:459 start_codon:yes stop_codon:yes gene_type:complete